MHVEVVDGLACVTIEPDWDFRHVAGFENAMKCKSKCSEENDMLEMVDAMQLSTTMMTLG